jgi:succinyl-diaminopimelate desuccinylase
MTEHNLPTLALTQQLMECPSVTPEDANCQKIIAKYLKKIGFTVQHLPFGPVKNLWATQGSQKPIFVFAGHTDVVPPGDLSKWETPPFTPTIKNGYLYGRGAADMKGSLAAMITACERFIHKNPHHLGTLAFLITSDEEGPAKEGTAKVIEYLQAQNIQLDYCIVGEPSGQDRVADILKNGRRGSLNGYLKILGTQGHIAYPYKAHNAIHAALLPLAELTATQWDQGNGSFSATSFQIANIKAGTGTTNVIPGVLDCQFNFRFSPESTPETLSTRVEKILESHGVQYELHWDVSGLPFLTKCGHLVSACMQAVQEITQITPQLSTAGGTSDGRFIATTGAELIEFGPCNTTIHCVNECVKIKDLELLSQIYERVLEHLLITSSRK